MFCILAWVCMGIQDNLHKHIYLYRQLEKTEIVIFTAGVPFPFTFLPW